MTAPGGSIRVDRPVEWRSRLAIAVGGILLFELGSGLALYLLPFSVSNQVMMIVHTLFGLLLVAPFAWYQLVHWRTYRHYTMTHTKATGYLGMGVTVACLVSGLVLTWQAAFGTRIGPVWDQVHLVTTFAVVGLVMPHIVLLVWRDGRAKPQTTLQEAARVAVLRSERRYGAGAALVGLLALAVVGAGVAAYRPPTINDEFPADYAFTHGKERPFAPSLARTETNWAFDSRTLSGSKSCGTSGCHEQITEEWAVSAHSYAAKDAAFQAIQEVMAKQNGAESTRYCGGCHDPISTFSGAKNIFAENLTELEGYEEGVSCLSCHGVKETDVKGNADYVIGRAERYLFEIDGSDRTQPVRDFLIRAYPRQHVDSLSKRLFKTPEYCAACHKQFIDQEVNDIGWVQLQNQYDNWRKSRWNHEDDPTKTVECRECHMPLVASDDPSAGDASDYNRTPDDGMHRSHRFLGANQLMPGLLELAGAEEQTRLTEAWLRGEIKIPEIADKWAGGAAVLIDIVTPPEAAPGDDVTVQVVLESNKVGHDFPTGPLDIIQAWVELQVTDAGGRVVFASGTVDEDHFIQKGSFMFKAEGVDQYGNLIDRHNLWEMVGVRFRRSLFPGFTDTAEYAFTVPDSLAAAAPGLRQVQSAPDALHVRAILKYRKIDQFLLNYVFGEDSGLTSPITDMSTAEVDIPIRDERAN